MPDTARRNLSDELLTQVVLESFENAGSPRIKEVLQSLVKHLHAFAGDVQLTEEEWAYGIDFLTRTGHITDDKRQEFILLSDVLGSVDAGRRHQPRGAGRRDRDDGVRPVLRGGLAAVHERRRHRQRRIGHAVLLPRRRALGRRRRADRGRATSRSGRPTRTASTTSSTPTSTTPRAAATSPPHGEGKLLVLVGEARGVPDPADGPGGRPARAPAARPDAPRAHPLQGQRARLPDAASRTSSSTATSTWTPTPCSA